MQLNGRPPRAYELAILGQINYGHFTSLQVRDRRAHGFDLHLRRLADATRTMFGSELDVEQVRLWAREVINEKPASLRITVFSRVFDRHHPERSVPVDVLMTMRAPSMPRSAALRLCTVQHERVLPQIKHIGMFDLLHYARQVRMADFDDVLLTTRNGEISEGSTWNIGFWDGQRVIWPSAPALFGITRQLLDAGLREQGIETRIQPIRIDQLANYRGAFILNAGAVGPMVQSIDSQHFAVDPALMQRLSSLHESQPLQRI